MQPLKGGLRLVCVCAQGRHSVCAEEMLRVPRGRHSGELPRNQGGGLAMWEDISGKLGDPEKLGWGGRREPQYRALSRALRNDLRVTDLCL